MAVRHIIAIAVILAVVVDEGKTVPVSKVELSVSCKNLRDVDTFSVSDPMCVLKQKTGLSSKWHELGRTEVVWNNLNPQFVTKFVVDYYFEEVQNLRFEVYDMDSKTRKRSAHDLLGSMECTLAELVSRESPFTKQLKNGKPGKISFITVTAEELSG